VERVTALIGFGEGVRRGESRGGVEAGKADQAAITGIRQPGAIEARHGDVERNPGRDGPRRLEIEPIGQDADGGGGKPVGAGPFLIGHKRRRDILANECRAQGAVGHRHHHRRWQSANIQIPQRDFHQLIGYLAWIGGADH